MRCGGAGAVEDERRSAAASRESSFTAGNRIDDLNVVRIEQQRARLALGRAGVRCALEIQPPLARHFDESAVARLAPAARADGAVGARHFIRPHDHLAAVAPGDCIGRDRRVRADYGAQGILHRGVLALEVAADEDGAAAGGAGNVYARVAYQPDLFTEHVHRAALARAARGFHFAGNQGGIARLDLYRPAFSPVGGRDATRFQCRVLRGPEYDSPVCRGLRAVRADLAAMIDKSRVNTHPARIRDDLSKVARLVVRRHDLDPQIRRARIHEFDAVTRRQHDFAVGGSDDPAVGDGGSDEVNMAAASGADIAVVFDGLSQPVGEAHAPVQEIRIAHAQGGGDEPSHVDLRSGAEHDAVGVDQKDAPARRHAVAQFRLQSTEYPGGILAGDTVQYCAGTGLLYEAGDLVRPDGERLPVDDRIGGIRNLQQIPHGVYRNLPADHGMAGRICQRRPRCKAPCYGERNQLRLRIAADISLGHN